MIAVSDPSATGTEQSGPSEGSDPWCTWCHFEPPDGELPYRIKGEDGGRWPPAFCSLQCAARWGNAAHQDRTNHVEHGRGLRADGGYPHADKDLSGGPDGSARTPCCFEEVETETTHADSGRSSGAIWRCPECGEEWQHPTETIGGPWGGSA